MTDQQTAPDPAADRDPTPGGFLDFARQAIAAGVIPELAPYQEAFLEALDGGRAPMTGDELHYAARRAGRRHMRAVIAAACLMHGDEVRFHPRDAVDAARMHDDAVEILDGLCAAKGIERPHLSLTILDEAPVRPRDAVIVDGVGICGRLLVGRGSDTYDPLCVLPAGHKGRCAPEATS